MLHGYPYSVFSYAVFIYKLFVNKKHLPPEKTFKAVNYGAI